MCPVCNGTCRRPAGKDLYKEIYAGYDKQTDTLPCNNCGGQMMYGRPTGQVPLNSLGEPCRHTYKSKTIGRCLTDYTCTECGHQFYIDSGD
jgi:DNA-directed RNA polymerase subunit RPC12/RpoP